MGEEDHRVQGKPRFDQVDPERSNARSGVEDEAAPAGLDLQAGGVTAVARGGRARARDRPARAPEPQRQTRFGRLARGRHDGTP